MNLIKYILFAIILLVIVAVPSYFYFIQNHTSYATAARSFDLNAEYDVIRKIVVRCDILEAIVTEQKGKVVSKKWDNLNLSSEKILKDLEIDGTANFVIENEHGLMEFQQSVFVGKDRIFVETKLVKPVAFIKNVNTVFSVKGRTGFFQVHLAYERRLPKFYQEKVDAEVKKAAERVLENNIKVITEIVEKYKNKKFIIPIKQR